MQEVRECARLVSHMLGIRSRREPAWRELSRWLCGWRGIFDGPNSLDHGEDDSTLTLFTGIANHAVLRGASGMSSGMTPRNTQWFRPCFTDEQMLEASGARAWLDALHLRMQDCLASGGFYQAIQNFNMDLVWAGCALLYSERGTDCALRFESVQIGTFCVALNHENRLDAVCRSLAMTPQTMAEVFGMESLSAATRASMAKNPYRPQTVWHLVRREQSGRFPFSSFYWEDRGEKFLRKSGYYEMPFFFTVWNEGITPYGTGPGDECLADARQMDILERRKLAGLGKLVDPPVTAPSHLKDIIDLSPGGINYSPTPDHIQPILDLSPYAQAIRGIQEEIQVVSQRLADGLMASIFSSIPLNQRPRDMSATEFLERKREALQQLGPVISAYEPNVLTPLLFRIAQTLDRAGLTPPTPPALANSPLLMKIDFISPMANALRQTSGEAIRALLQDMGAISEMSQNPEIFDKLDLDQAIDELATAIGAPGSVVRSDDDVAQIRAQRAQAQAQIQQQQQASQLLPILKNAQEVAMNTQQMQETENVL